MGEFVEHLKRKAESAGCEVIEHNAYKLKMSQYDPATDAYRKKPLKERWHRWGNTGTLVQRDAMSAFLACHATEKGHDRALLLEKWTTAEALLSGSGLCRHEPCSDPEVSKDTSGLTKPNCGSKAERERGLPHTLCTDGDVQAALPHDTGKAAMTVDSSCGTAAEKERGEERSPDRWMVVLLNDDYPPFDWVIDVLIRIFERTPVDAMTVTRSVHQQGRGIAGVYPRVKALRLVAKCMSEARRDGYPFTCIAVPAEGGGLSL